MAPIGFSSESFRLLQALRSNNTKAWYADNRAAFKDHLLQPFEDMLLETAERLAGHEFEMLGGPQTMFRQDRDARFNKGPNAYHTYVSGMLSPSGTKDASFGVIYARLTITGGFLSAGFHDLSTKQLNKFRDHILRYPDKYKKIIDELGTAGLIFPEDMDPFDLPSLSLTMMPRGYAQHADTDLAVFIRRKSFAIFGLEARNIWIEGSVPKRIAEIRLAMANFFRFGMHALTLDESAA